MDFTLQVEATFQRVASTAVKVVFFQLGIIVDENPTLKAAASLFHHPSVTSLTLADGATNFEIKQLMKELTFKHVNNFAFIYNAYKL